MLKRIQRKRTKGWRMPEDTIYVGRGSDYGNPHKVSYFLTITQSVELFEKDLTTLITPVKLAKLTGKNLVCWCKEDAICHADILLKYANLPCNDYYIHPVAECEMSGQHTNVLSCVKWLGYMVKFYEITPLAIEINGKVFKDGLFQAW